MRPQITRLVRWACVLGVAAAVLIAVLNTTPGDQTTVPSSAASGDGETVQTDHGPLGPADRDLLAKVRQAGLWEMPTGQDMQQRASAERVREVGGLIAGEHAELDRIVRDAAAELGVALPNQPTGQQRDWIEQIGAASEADYDRTAINLLRQAHGKVLPVIAQVRSGTRNDLIRDFATTAAEFVTRHHEYLESTGLVDFAALPEPAAPDTATPPSPAAAAGYREAPQSVPPAAAESDPVPVADSRQAGSGGDLPTPVDGSTILSAVVAVGAVLGAGALLGLMLHTGSRREGNRSRPRASTDRRPAPSPAGSGWGRPRPPVGHPVAWSAPRAPRPPAGWAGSHRPPPAGFTGRGRPAPVNPARRRGDRAQAMFALVLAVGLVGTLVFAGRSPAGPERGPERTVDVAAAAAVPAVDGNAHGNAHGDGDAHGDGNAHGDGHAHGGGPTRRGASGSGAGDGRDRDTQSRGSGDGGQRVNGLEVVGRDCGNSGLTPHDGFQEGRRCVDTAAGEVSAAEDNPSLLITGAPQRVEAGEPFELRVSTRNLVRDRFLAAADGGYYVERSELTSEGIQRGHFHTACRMLESTGVAPDPDQEPAAFVATEDGGGGARPDEVTVQIPGLRQRGIAQCAVWAGDGSHRIPMMERANETPAFDVVRLRVQ